MPRVPHPSLLPFVLGTVLLGATPATAQRLAWVDSLVAEAYPASGPGAAVLVARDGHVIHRSAHGMADVELGVPLAPDHVLRIGSITKQFTGVAVLMLVEEGKVSLDDDLATHFPGWPTHGHRITVEHLLHHTSGIRSYTSMPTFGGAMRRDLALDSLLAVFRDEPMDFAPGADFRYNNSAYVMLGALIERASGMSYADFVRTRIFEPLGMRDTRFDDTGEVIPRRVTGYSGRRDGALRNAGYLSMTLPHAAGSLVSTVDDLHRWNVAVAERRLLRDESWRRAFAPARLADGRSTRYGAGWFLGTLGGAGTVEHGGDINGFSSDALSIPERGVHVVVLANVERGYANPATVTARVAERLLDLGPEPAVALAPEALDAFVGVYAAAETDRRVVLRDGATLYSRRGNGERQELRPVGGDRFLYPSTGTSATFVRGADGVVTGMLVVPRMGPEQTVSPRISTDPDGAEARGPAAVELPVATLDRYVGSYRIAPQMVLAVRRDGAVLRVLPTGQAERALVPIAETRFAIDGVPGAVLEFDPTGTGPVPSATLHQGGQRMQAPRIP